MGSPCGGSGACEAGGPRPNCPSSSGAHPLEPRVAGARLARAVRGTRAGVDRLWAGGAPVGRALLRAAFPELREAPGPGLVAWLWDQKHPASEWGGRGFGGLSRTLGRGAPLSSQASEAWPRWLARRLLLPTERSGPLAALISRAGRAWLPVFEGRTWERLTLRSGQKGDFYGAKRAWSPATRVGEGHLGCSQFSEFSGSVSGIHL